MSPNCSLDILDALLAEALKTKNYNECYKLITGFEPGNDNGERSQCCYPFVLIHEYEAKKKSEERKYSKDNKEIKPKDASKTQSIIKLLNYLANDKNFYKNVANDIISWHKDDDTKKHNKRKITSKTGVLIKNQIIIEIFKRNNISEIQEFIKEKNVLSFFNEYVPKDVLNVNAAIKTPIYGNNLRTINLDDYKHLDEDTLQIIKFYLESENRSYRYSKKSLDIVFEDFTNDRENKILEINEKTFSKIKEEVENNKLTYCNNTNLGLKWLNAAKHIFNPMKNNNTDFKDIFLDIYENEQNQTGNNNKTPYSKEDIDEIVEDFKELENYALMLSPQKVKNILYIDKIIKDNENKATTQEKKEIIRIIMELYPEINKEKSASTIISYCRKMCYYYTSSIYFLNNKVKEEVKDYMKKNNDKDYKDFLFDKNELSKIKSYNDSAKYNESFLHKVSLIETRCSLMYFLGRLARQLISLKESNKKNTPIEKMILDVLENKFIKNLDNKDIKDKIIIADIKNKKTLQHKFRWEDVHLNKDAQEVLYHDNRKFIMPSIDEILKDWVYIYDFCLRVTNKFEKTNNSDKIICTLLFCRELEKKEIQNILSMKFDIHNISIDDIYKIVKEWHNTTIGIASNYENYLKYMKCHLENEGDLKK